jgi:ABC-2 type transport system ATP-binding protein
LSFALPKGSICGFIGPNGAGKTTTMRICSTLELPDSGDVFVAGYSVLSHPDEVRQHIGFMPDAFPIDPTILVRDMLDFFGRAHGLWGTELQAMKTSVIDFTALDDMLDKQFGSLSKGMKQRAALATVLMHDPSLLILDEPAAGLDPRARVELRTLLRLLADQGKTILISSHILAELTEICTHAVVIEQGCLKANRSLIEVDEAEVENGDPVAIGSDAAPQPRPLVRLYVESLQHPEFLCKAIQAIDGVQSAVLHQKGVVMEFEGGKQKQAELLKYLVEQDLHPTRFVEQKMDLEDLFLSLTEGKVQ